MKAEYVILSTTAGNEAEAGKLADGLVSARKAACVQMLPIKSRYRWQGKVESSDEILLLVKTRAVLADDVISYIKANHSYDVPEVLVTPVIGGLPEYLGWIEDETK